jgi:hypothetical protein
MTRLTIERNAGTPRIDLSHAAQVPGVDCDGYLRNEGTQGTWHWLRCTRCEARLIAEIAPEEHKRLRAIEDERHQAWVKRMEDTPPPEPNGREVTGEEARLLDLYSAWSEDRYAAGFMSPSPDTVDQFITWLNGPGVPRRAWDYEIEMLDEYARRLADRKAEGGQD